MMTNVTAEETTQIRDRTSELLIAPDHTPQLLIALKKETFCVEHNVIVAVLHTCSKNAESLNIFAYEEKTLGRRW